MMVVVGEDRLTYPFIRGAAKLGRWIPCHLHEILRVRGGTFSGRYGNEKTMILEREIMKEEAMLTGVSKARSRPCAKGLSNLHF